MSDLDLLLTQALSGIAQAGKIVVVDHDIADLMAAALEEAILIIDAVASIHNFEVHYG